MRIPDETFSVELTADDIEMLVNSIAYERANNSFLTEDYKQELLLLSRTLASLIEEV